jgi:hypothetical protein
VIKTMKLGAVVLQLVCGLFPSSAFALPGDCEAVCGPTVSCGKPCILNGSGTACGGYGCCVANRTNCPSLAASNSASGEALTLEALFAPEQPAAPALPAFLAE